MSKRTLEPPLLGIVAVYFFCFTLVLWPITDFFTTALPLQLGRVEWRYASLGLMTVYLTTPILGLGLAMVTAFFLRQQRVLRTLSILCLLSAVFLIGATLALGMDMIQLWERTTPPSMLSFRVGGFVAGAKLFTGLTTLLLLGVGGWQAGRLLSEAVASKKDSGLPAPWLGSAAKKPEEES